MDLREDPPFSEDELAWDDPVVRQQNLTAREAEVLKLVVEELQNLEIAQQLNISVNTVEAHLKSIYKKLGVRNRAGATSWYWRSGGGRSGQN